MIRKLGRARERDKPWEGPVVASPVEGGCGVSGGRSGSSAATAAAVNRRLATLPTGAMTAGAA